jgi:hypothetical protein
MEMSAREKTDAKQQTNHSPILGEFLWKSFRGPAQCGQTWIIALETREKAPSNLRYCSQALLEPCSMPGHAPAIYDLKVKIFG